jgi:hypothetical protein
VALCALELSRGEDGRVNAGVSYQTFQSWEAMDVTNLSIDSSRRSSPYAFDGSEMLGHLTEKSSQGSFYSFGLHFQELHLSQKATELNCGSIPKVRQSQRGPGCLLEMLCPLRSQTTSRSLYDHPCNLSQIKGGKLLGGSSPLEELLRSGNEHTGEEALIFGEDLIQHPENPPLSITHLVNEFHAEAGQVTHRLDVRTGHIAWSNPANAQQVGNNPSIPPVVLDLTNGRAAVGVGLERIDCHQLETLLEEVVIEGKPVMTSGLKSDDARLRLLAKNLYKGSYALSGVLEPKKAAYLVAICVQQADLVGTFPDIDADRNHEAPPKAYLCGRAVPNSMRAYSLVRDAWPNHNLLIGSPSQERGSILSCEAYPSRRLSAAPASHAIEFTPRSMGFQS